LLPVILNFATSTGKIAVFRASDLVAKGQEKRSGTAPQIILARTAPVHASPWLDRFVHRNSFTNVVARVMQSARLTENLI
jgi:hypothetical protein